MVKAFIGIDIGARFTKVVELEYANKPYVSNAFLFLTPFSSGREGEQIDTKPFWQEITNHIPSNKLHISKIGINIPSTSITALTVLLPHMPEKDLFATAINEARRRMLPASTPNHIFECLFLGEKTVGKVSRSEVLVIRTEKPHIQKIIDLFQEIDIQPSLITPASIAVLNIMPKDSWSKEEDAVFADLGMRSIGISVCREGKLFFTRDVAYGFQDIFSDISGQLGLSAAEAESSIKELGVPQIAFDPKDKVAIAEEIMRQKYEAGLRPGESQKPKVNLLELRMLWQPHIERIIHELRRSFAYYKEESQGRRIGYINFLGGGSQTINLIPNLSSQLGGKCQVILPFKGFSVANHGLTEEEAYSTPIFVNATSLALTVISESKKQPAINFLPLEIKRKEAVAARRLLFLVTGIGFSSVCALISINLFLGNLAMKKSIEKENFELIRVKRITMRLKDLSQREKELNQVLSQINEIAKGKQDFSELLRQVARLIPRGIVLVNLSVFRPERPLEEALNTPEGSAGGEEPLRMTIKGNITADYEEALEIMEDFQKRLQSCRLLTNIKAETLKLEEISYQIITKDKQGVRLTGPRSRDFTLTAELVKE